jgi:nicotinamide-nucleotide amidase
MFPPELLAAAEDVLATLRTRTLTLATAESCTGGLIAGALTEIAGSSDVFDRGFVTYSNDAKMASLGVPAEVLRHDGAVSEACARAMAEGALVHSEADIAVAVTGVAGPGGGSIEKPVGLVHLAAARIGASTVHRELRLGAMSRSAIRLRTVAVALEMARTMALSEGDARPE